MSNVWGSGGLFERALANKLENQSMAQETSRMNAETDLLKANNAYDLGLRDSGINQFNAETTRADKANMWGGAMTNGSANNLGLRTFNPVSASSDLAKAAAPRPSLGIMPPQPGVSSTATAFNKMTTPTSTQEDQKIGMKKGGKVAKMACAKGGKIGDVENDEGEDTIDAKVRPGEYMLNPETVAHIGGGNYDKGVRNLNAIVREATGKEPGPSPVGKSDKPGFGVGGVYLPPEYAEDLRVDLSGKTIAEEQPAARGTGERVWSKEALKAEAERAAANTRFEQAAKGGYKPPAEPVSMRSYINNNVFGEQALLNEAQKDAVKATAKNIGGKAAGAVKSVPGSIAKNFNTATNTLAAGDDLGMVWASDVSTPEKIAGSLEALGNTATGFLADRVGKGLGALGISVGNSMTDSRPLSALARSMYGKSSLDMIRDSYGENKPEPVGPVTALANTANKLVGTPTAADVAANIAQAQKAAEAEQNTTTATTETSTTAPATGTKDSAKAPAAAAQTVEPPSLRDMMIRQIVANNGSREFIGSGRRAEENMALFKELAGIEKDGAADAKSAAAAKLAGQKETDDRINERYQIPKFDKDGNVTGYEKNPDAAREVRDQLAEQGIDLYSAPPAVVDNYLKNRDALDRGLRNFNDTVTNERGSDALISKNLRGMQIKKGISLPDTWGTNNALTLGDWWDAKMSGDKEVGNMQVIDPVTGQSVAASRVFRTPDGRAIDADAFAAFTKAQTKGK